MHTRKKLFVTGSLSTREDTGTSWTETKNAMKRKLSVLYERGNITDVVKVKRDHSGSSPKQPASYIAENAPVLSQHAALIIRSIRKNNIAFGSSMDVDNSSHGNFLFLFFLDAQGKEQIKPIRDKILQFTHTESVFISSNISHEDHEYVPSISFSNTEECKFLTREIGLLDPLGGGAYPLNYLVIIDSQMTIRFQVPMKFSHCYGAYQKFGLRFTDLHGVIEEYSRFASTQENKESL